MSEKAGSPEGTGVAATAMFVEVLVIGVGALTAIGVGAGAILGPKSLLAVANISSPVTAVVLISMSYALGILVDRAADRLLRGRAAKLRAGSFEDDDAYGLARLKLTRTPALAARAEYARSRLRVCRGWMLDGAGLTVAGVVYLARFGGAEQRLPAITLVAIGGFTFSLCAFLAWRSIVGTGYRTLARQATMIDQMSSDS